MVDMFLLPSAAARELGVSVARVRQLVDAGTLPAQRGSHGYRLIPAAAVRQLVEERKNRERRRNVAAR